MSTGPIRLNKFCPDRTSGLTSPLPLRRKSRRRLRVSRRRAPDPKDPPRTCVGPGSPPNLPAWESQTLGRPSRARRGTRSRICMAAGEPGTPTGAGGRPPPQTEIDEIRKGTGQARLSVNVFFFPPTRGCLRDPFSFSSRALAPGPVHGPWRAPPSRTAPRSMKFMAAPPLGLSPGRARALRGQVPRAPAVRENPLLGRLVPFGLLPGHSSPVKPRCHQPGRLTRRSPRILAGGAAHP